ncbi:MAG TPA: AMP-binding protein [Bryobacteraceae bacterium]|jgi:putative adenylate-forming enzyme|nr:AMP-binding protein [Bryobacteraceae bacterium]
MASKLLLQLQVFRKRRELERSCHWTGDQLAAHQHRSAADLRRFAISQSPFYARFHRGMENRPLEELPILTKSVLMENFDDLVTDRSIRLSDVEEHLNHDDGNGFYQGRYVALSTSGSTGLRGVFLFNPGEWLECLASIARPMKWAGVAPSPLRRERAVMVASATPWHYSARIGRSLETSMLPTLRLDAGEPVEVLVRRLNDWRPGVLVAYPSVLRQLSEEQLSGRLDIAPRVCATSAEVLTAETRRRVRDAWNIPVFETYGATEYAPIAAECPSGRRHLFEDGAVIENTDQHGRPLPPGVMGERVLLTIFSRRTQPLIRYEISDLVRLSDAKCDCGRPFRCVEEIQGRQEDVLYFRSFNEPGRLVPVHPNVFHRLLENVPATGWQVVHEDRSLTVNLTGVHDETDLFRVELGLLDLFRTEGLAAPPVRAGRVTELRRGATGKAPLIVSLTSTAKPVQTRAATGAA